MILDLIIFHSIKQQIKHFDLWCNKNLYDAKSLRIIFEKVDGYVRKYDTTKFLGLFHSNEKYETIFEKIRYLVLLKKNVSDVYPHKYLKIKIDSDDGVLLEKTWNIYNVVIIPVKSVFNKNRSHYYYQAVLGKCACK